MARSHYCQVTFDADIKGAYQLDLVGSKTIATIAAARIWRNIGRKAASGYAAKRGLDIRLVRLACQLEAMQKADRFAKIMASAKKEKASPFASWALINCKEFDNVVWG